MQRLLLKILLILVAEIQVIGFSPACAGEIRVACIGNSVTFGYGLGNRETECYPSQLQKLLGKGYLVENFGHNGATLLRKGHKPYVLTDEYKRALAFTPDLVIIDLGLNDTDPRNWPDFGDGFIPDYLSLIRSFQNQGNKPPTIYICLMTPIFHTHPRFKSGTREWFWQIQEKIEKVARNTGVGLIDLHSPLYCRPDLFKDALHPDALGNLIIAETIFNHITGNFGGLKLAPVFRNNMVFQQKSTIRIWGISNAGDEIKGIFGQQVQTCVANSSGNWTLNFNPVPAGGPYSLKIESREGKSILLDNILVGEVWVCAGQSNMEFPLKNTQNAGEEIAKETNANIRLFNLKGIVRPDDSKWDNLTLEKTNSLGFFNGTWEIDDKDNRSDFSGVGFYFGRMLNKKLDVPVGLIQLSVGGAPIEAFMDRKSLESNPALEDVLNDWVHNDFYMEWCRQRAALNLSLSENKFQRHPFEPAFIYEAGVSKIAGLSIGGVIWYQGESNTHNAEHYKAAFPVLVQSWREAFGNPAMPFLFAQLSGIDRPSWPLFRDTQRQLCHLVKNSGMVVTFDLGDSLNVHPVRKREVGERFAKLALEKVYGVEKTGCSPEIEEVIRLKDRIVLKFNHAGRLATSDHCAVRELEIAGWDDIFVPVNAKMKRNRIYIDTQSRDIQKIRYAWKPFSRGNIINEAGLPASTFKIKINN